MRPQGALLEDPVVEQGLPGLHRRDQFRCRPGDLAGLGLVDDPWRELVGKHQKDVLVLPTIGSPLEHRDVAAIGESLRSCLQIGICLGHSDLQLFKELSVVPNAKNL